MLVKSFCWKRITSASIRATTDGFLTLFIVNALPVMQKHNAVGNRLKREHSQNTFAQDSRNIVLRPSVVALMLADVIRFQQKLLTSIVSIRYSLLSTHALGVDTCCLPKSFENARVNLKHPKHLYYPTNLSSALMYSSFKLIRKYPVHYLFSEN